MTSQQYNNLKQLLRSDDIANVWLAIEISQSLGISFGWLIFMCKKKLRSKEYIGYKVHSTVEREVISKHIYKFGNLYIGFHHRYGMITLAIDESIESVRQADCEYSIYQDVEYEVNHIHYCIDLLNQEESTILELLQTNKS